MADENQNDQATESNETLDPRAVTIARFFQEHPDMLPQKFANAENPGKALLESYLSLESRLGSGDGGEQTEEEDDSAADTGESDDSSQESIEFGATEDGAEADERDFEWAKKEIATIGGKASEQVTQLLKTKYNFTDSMVKDLENTVATQRQAMVQKAMDVMGGKENFNRLNEWLMKNKSPDEIARINKAITEPDGQIVLRGLMDLAGVKKTAQPKKSPVGGTDMSNLIADGVQPYKSFTEVAKVLKSQAFTRSTHPDHKRTVAEYQARAAATIKAGNGALLAGG